MRKGMVAVALVACAAMVLATGSSPRYLEELRIGGGYGEPADGGADFDKAGNITTDGDVTCGDLAAWAGGVVAGRDTETRGLLTAWDGAGETAPGCLKLASADGTLRYVFAANDGSGLRIHGILPTADTDGQWLKARTVEDLTAPPPIGSVTPNTGKFSSAEVTGNATVGGNLQVNGTNIGISADTDLLGLAGSALTVRGALASNSTFTVWRNNTYGNGEDAAVFMREWRATGGRIGTQYKLQDASYATCVYGWAGTVIEDNTVGSVDGGFRIDLAENSVVGTKLTLSSAGNLTATGDLAANGGDIAAGVQNQTRGEFVAWSGSGGNAPGVLKLVSPNGTIHYYFAEDDGTLKVHTTLPTSNGNGTEVGAQFSSTITAFTGDDTTPSVSGGLVFKVPGTWTAGHNIIMFDNGAAGQQIIVIGGDADCIVVDGGHLVLAANWTAAPGKTLSLVNDGTDWYETARSDN